MSDRIDIDHDLVQQYITRMSTFGAYGETGVWRTVYSPEWVAAQQQITEWCQEAGLTVRKDAVGNVWGRLEGLSDGPVVATGSHVDSLNPGGRFDGVLGVLAGVIALRKLKQQFGVPKRSIEVVSFCEEEASRFPSTNFWGSRAVIGDIGPEEPDTVRSHSGETIAEAMRAVGLDPSLVSSAKRNDIDTFVELHIEQGPILEQEKLPVGIVQGITGLRHYSVELGGRSDHAGGVPMDLRRDPMVGASEIISGVIRTAENWGRPARTTVGRIFAEPNLLPAVPERVTFTIDVRHPDPELVQELYASHERLIEEVARKRNLDLNWRVIVEHQPCLSSPDLVEVLKAAARSQNVPVLPMYSGGGHDSQRMARIAKVAMVFVQSKNGRSHTPAEFTETVHAVEGIRVLASALHKLAY